ncbi:formyltetrahydrofolate-dependent phosphoribosylglycinamide formyltransferase [Sinobaca qinghaiensis]|uniref:Phosphoribosylglycinamide formyltransferase n=1 Tax=Sinobaca qinghaiensis TaxID=342944 RepID=A0A419UZY9_9BACL|nr:phosphoribosylglycinamide formyltransferase [Sinobaca qinghaiensis]RKD71253.1 formyltetrahydrofolate-dependent phosphoribosylglycinamide formyltransferase [Sinobaca qinghaiensis]
MKKIAVFASGSGSNFEAIVRAEQEGRLDAAVSLLVCDKPQAAVVRKAEALNIPVFSFLPKQYDSKQAFETEIVQELEQHSISFVFLAGYMRLIGSVLLQAFEGRIINIHPSLLPAFPGKDAIGQAWEAGVKITGVTIHYVDEGMDTGRIIAQEAVNIRRTDSKETLTNAIQAIEHRLYPEVIDELAGKLERSF